MPENIKENLAMPAKKKSLLSPTHYFIYRKVSIAHIPGARG
jgi:hypothetical protein